MSVFFLACVYVSIFVLNVIFTRFIVVGADRFFTSPLQPPHSCFPLWFQERRRRRARKKKKSTRNSRKVDAKEEHHTTMNGDDADALSALPSTASSSSSSSLSSALPVVGRDLFRLPLPSSSASSRWATDEMDAKKPPLHEDEKETDFFLPISEASAPRPSRSTPPTVPKGGVCCEEKVPPPPRTSAEDALLSALRLLAEREEAAPTPIAAVGDGATSTTASTCPFPPPSPSSSSSVFSEVEEKMLTRLASDCCALPVQSSKTHVLHHPTDFYTTLCEIVSSAEKEITLCALYIGDGPLASALMEKIRARAKAVVDQRRKNSHRRQGRLHPAVVQAAGSRSTSPLSFPAHDSPLNAWKRVEKDEMEEEAPFRIRIVIDYHRMHLRHYLNAIKPLLELLQEVENEDEAEEEGEATRCVRDASQERSPPPRGPSSSFSSPSPSSVSSASPAFFSNRFLSVEISLYQHPSPLTKHLASLGRFREALGVQHAKIISIDQRRTIFTGANLSDDYFTTRFDRYLLVDENPFVGKWFVEVVQAIAAVSHPVDTLERWGKKTLPNEWRKKLHAFHTAQTNEQAKDTTTDLLLHHFLHTCPFIHVESIKGPPGKYRTAASTLFPSSLPPPSPFASPTGEIESEFPFGVPPSCAFPLYHTACRLVILPNRCGKHPSCEFESFVRKEQEVLKGFAQRMRREYEGLALNALLDGENGDEGDKGHPHVDTPASRRTTAPYDTIIFPALQCGPAGIFHESVLVEALLRLATTPTRTASPLTDSHAEEGMIDAAAHHPNTVAMKRTVGNANAVREPSTHLYFSSPYMNISPSYMDSLLRGRPETIDGHTLQETEESEEEASAPPALWMDCITANVKTNGWNNVKGATIIPQIYLQLERAFWYILKDFGAKADHVRIWEFSKGDGSSFHSKGFWFVPARGKENNDVESTRRLSTAASSHTEEAGVESCSSSRVEQEGEEGKRTKRQEDIARIRKEKRVRADPYLVSYGSTNYGYRSVYRDVEVSMFVFTTNLSLRRVWREELEYLLSLSTLVDEERDFKGYAAGRYKPFISLIAQLVQSFL